MGILYTSNFDSATSGQIAPGWGNITGTWTVGTIRPISGTQSFGEATASDGDVVLLNQGAGASGIAPVTTMGLKYDQQLSTTNTTIVVLVPVLKSDATFTNGYFVRPNASNTAWQFYKRVNGINSALGSQFNSAYTLTVNDKVYVRTAIVGSGTFNELCFKIWKTTNTEPSSWDGSFCDSQLLTLTGNAGTTLHSYQGTDGATHIYQFNELSGTTATDTGSSPLNATYATSGITFGEPPLTPDQKSCVLLNGSTGYVTMPFNDANNGAFTIEIVCYQTGGTTARLVSNSHTDADQRGFQVLMDNAGISFDVGNGSTSFLVQGPTTWQLGARMHIVAVFTGTQLYLYVNGSLYGPTNFTGSYATAANAMVVGRNAANGLDVFGGYVEAFAVYPTALSTAQVMNHYNALNNGTYGYDFTAAGYPGIYTYANGGASLAAQALDDYAITDLNYTITALTNGDALTPENTKHIVVGVPGGPRGSSGSLSRVPLFKRF